MPEVRTERHDAKTSILSFSKEEVERVLRLAALRHIGLYEADHITCSVYVDPSAIDTATVVVIEDFTKAPDMAEPTPPVTLAEALAPSCSTCVYYALEPDVDPCRPCLQQHEYTHYTPKSK